MTLAYRLHNECLVTNVKVSWRTTNRELVETLLELYHTPTKAGVVFYSNFAVVRPTRSKLVYTIYHNAGFVNCTGIKGTNLIREAISLFRKLFLFKICCKRLIYAYKIDSISGVVYLKRDIPLHKITCDQVVIPEEISIIPRRITTRYDPQIFAARRLSVDGACISIFANGTLSIVGAKSKQELQTLSHIAQHVLHTSPK
jgi:TATA-box binding protein (TBP) (component of TFIID and TFIIIB)